MLALPVGANAADDVQVRVMTRNVYLGADLSPAINAESTNDFVVANGQIIRDVGTNNFATRARGLAQEILDKRPDLVGLQEVALWRSGPLNNAAPFTCDGVPDEDSPFGCDFTASNVRYDFLRDLLRQLNSGQHRYRIVSPSGSSTSRLPPISTASRGTATRARPSATARRTIA